MIEVKYCEGRESAGLLVSGESAPLEMKYDLSEIQTRFLDEIRKVSSSETLDEIRVRYLGKKGEISSLLKEIGSLSPGERPAFGAAANALRDKLVQSITSKKEELERLALEEALKKERLDVTLPGRIYEIGGFHPLTKALQDVTAIFAGMGFAVYESRETETDEMNFVKLNIAPGHPARDMQETFYLSDTTLMRTHTSPGQIRGMLSLKGKLPVRFVVPGRVYRRDPTDASHHPVFHQVEGLAVDTDITFQQLRGVISSFMKRFFGQDLDTRLRPSYFPFTEPSCEVDISCVLCQGKGCSVCGSSGYLEVAGAGMVHPDVIKNGGYDPENVTGFAFGFGLDRLAMLKYAIDDIRLLYENDRRFISQFRGL